MTDRKLIQQALDALEYASDQTKPENLHGCDCLICTTILALRKRLAQPERQWIGLTDEEVKEIIDKYTIDDYGFDIWCDGLGVVKAIETKLKEKNT